MTRINCIPVDKLSRPFLIAEYREMLRFRHVYPRKTKLAIPPMPTYRMGKGHVKFFYDKGLYLLNRHKQLREEMVRRGYVARYTLDLSSWPQRAMNDWEPNVDDKLLNMSRLIVRAQ